MCKCVTAYIFIIAHEKTKIKGNQVKMRSLNTNFEKSKTPQTEKAAVFGEGNFLRAFIGVLYERMNRNAGYDGGVVLLQGLPNGLAEKINAQDGLYTVIERGMADGEASELRVFSRFCSERCFRGAESRDTL